MFVSEYGYHGTLGGVMDNARRIYRSTDYGYSWEVVFSPTSVHMSYGENRTFFGTLRFELLNAEAR